MKSASVLLALLLAVPAADAQVNVGITGNVGGVYLNEIHYGNAGTDAGEFVEVVGPAGTDLGTYFITLYNGSTGDSYAGTDPLTSLALANPFQLSGIIDDEGAGFGAISFFIANIRNGAPSGIALSKAGLTDVQLLSYGGTFVANDGPAATLLSVDIGVSESGSTPAGQSLEYDEGTTTWLVSPIATPGDYLQGNTPGIAPDIAVLGNATPIADGDGTPSATDHTDFGNAGVAGATVSRTFTIRNLGQLSLALGGTPRVAIGGAHAADFQVTATPGSPVAAGGGATTFTVQFDPSAPGTRSATISIASNDADENPYDFAIQGTGVDTSAEVSIVKTLDTLPPYVAGQTVIYTLVVANAGPAAATSVQVTDTPTNLSITLVSGGGCAALPCTLPGLSPGASATITVAARILAAGPFDNVAGATAAETDGDSANNSDAAGNGGTALAVPVPAPAAIPASTGLGLLLVSLVSGLAGAWFARRQDGPRPAAVIPRLSSATRARRRPGAASPPPRSGIGPSRRDCEW